MANPHGQDLPPALAHQPKVYQRSFQRHLRVLEAKMANLQIQLNDELSEKSSSSSGLQEDMGTNNTIPDQVPSCSELLDEIKRFSTKRDAILAANQQKINPGGDGDGNGDTPPPPAAGI